MSPSVSLSLSLCLSLSLSPSLVKALAGGECVWGGGSGRAPLLCIQALQEQRTDIRPKNTQRQPHQLAVETMRASHCSSSLLKLWWVYMLTVCSQKGVFTCVFAVGLPLAFPPPATQPAAPRNLWKEPPESASPTAPGHRTDGSFRWTRSLWCSSIQTLTVCFLTILSGIAVKMSSKKGTAKWNQNATKE